MTASLEQIVRPSQTAAPGVAIPLTKKASEPVLVVILAGSGVKSFTGETSLSTVAYSKKYPSEFYPAPVAPSPF